jgi:hypothetical protein
LRHRADYVAGLTPSIYVDRSVDDEVEALEAEAALGVAHEVVAAAAAAEEEEDVDDDEEEEEEQWECDEPSIDGRQDEPAGRTTPVRRQCDGAMSTRHEACTVGLLVDYQQEHQVDNEPEVIPWFPM